MQSKSSNSIYVQGFSPEDISEELVHSTFSRCGLIKSDGNKSKIKLYRDKANGNVLKGDCLVTFVLPESVSLAIQLFDDVEYKPGFKLQVSQAEFQPNAATAATTATGEPSKTRNEKEVRLKKVRRMHERAKLSWDEEGGPSGGLDSALLIVVLKGLFVPGEDFDDLELERDLIEGLDPILSPDMGGREIKKITVFKSHPEAVIVIRFNDSKTALDCVELMDGRWFDGRKVSAQLWDGVTEYAPQVNLEDKAKEEEERLERFEREIEQ